jgi:hypothetical protein
LREETAPFEERKPHPLRGGNCTLGPLREIVVPSDERAHSKIGYVNVIKGVTQCGCYTGGHIIV